MTGATRWHGRALVAAAAAVPVGEGLAFGGLVLLAILTAVRWRDLDLDVLRRGTTGRWLMVLGVWVLLGAASLLLGGEGWRKPGELGRWLPLLVAPVVVLSAAALPPRWTRRAAVAFLIMLTVACLFGLYQYAFNARPGESLSRISSTVASQGRIPGAYWRSAAGGFYFHRLKMAHVLILGVGLIVARQLFARLTPGRRAFEVGVLALFCATLVLHLALHDHDDALC